MISPGALRSFIDAFNLYGEFIGAAPYGSGHINDTYCAQFNQGGTRVRYIVQRINESISEKRLSTK